MMQLVYRRIYIPTREVDAVVNIIKVYMHHDSLLAYCVQKSQQGEYNVVNYHQTYVNNKCSNDELKEKIELFLQEHKLSSAILQFKLRSYEVIPEDSTEFKYDLNKISDELNEPILCLEGYSYSIYITNPTSSPLDEASKRAIKV